MADRCYLAVDLGAESGRVIAGGFDGRRVTLDELHRFPNGPVAIAGSLRWNVLGLWSGIQEGLARAAACMKNDVASVGVDTWGVDYVLLDKAGELLGLPYHYRDSRSHGMLAEATARIPREMIFTETGLQFMEINTVYQLLAHRRHDAALLDAANRLLLMPDFFHWCLCGSKVVEFTNATTTQLVHPLRRTWADSLLRGLRIPGHLFGDIVTPGTPLGALRSDVAASTGLGKVPVVAPATHDTASAVVAVPTERTGTPNWAYISSGTWSLIGVEVDDAILTEQALHYNVTNEGGVDGTYRLLKNVMGLWLVQELKRSFAKAGKLLEYDDLTRLAAQAKPFEAFVDPDDEAFLSPADMPSAMRDYGRRTGQTPPGSEGQLVRCALESLALKYRVVLGRLEQLTGVPIEVVHVVGGGGRNELLNRFTAGACNRPVIAGPVEATAFGNVLIQARAAGEIGSLAEVRSIVRASCELKTFEPQNVAEWNEAAARFESLL
ncbi:MAG: rhamnulokinase family protein [Planctomycetaceae bacterium]